MHARRVLWLAIGMIAVAAAAEPAAPPADSDELYKAGQQLFDEYAPQEVKENYAFPSKEDWDAFNKRLQYALQNNSLEELAAFEPEARAVLAAASVVPGYEDYAEWLQATHR